MNDSPDIPRYARPHRWTAARRRGFIVALSNTGHVGKACRAVGLSRNAAYLLRARDPDFAARWDAALSAHREAGFIAREECEALSVRRRRASSSLRQLRYLDKLMGFTW